MSVCHCPECDAPSCSVEDCDRVAFNRSGLCKKHIDEGRDPERPNEPVEAEEE